MKAKADRGPKWEQLTDQQRVNVDRLFTTIERIVRKYKAEQGGVA